MDGGCERSPRADSSRRAEGGRSAKAAPLPSANAADAPSSMSRISRAVIPSVMVRDRGDLRSATAHRADGSGAAAPAASTAELSLCGSELQEPWALARCICEPESDRRGPLKALALAPAIVVGGPMLLTSETSFGKLGFVEDSACAGGGNARANGRDDCHFLRASALLSGGDAPLKPVVTLSPPADGESDGAIDLTPVAQPRRGETDDAEEDSPECPIASVRLCV